MKTTLTVGSLFSGIGGLDLGLERAGMTVRWQSEIDPYACRVLAKHWPHVPNLGDITQIEWSNIEPVDLICGGYPCQPFSLAGVRRGDTDPRHLWPHFADAIRVLRPRYALLENVPGHLSLGFGRVLGDLAELGFDAEWDCIPAAAVGAPHLRYRVIIVATNTDVEQHQSGAHAQRRPPAEDVPTDSERVELRQQPIGVGRGSGAAVTRNDGSTQHVADSHSVGSQGGSITSRGEEVGFARDESARSSAASGGRYVADADGGRFEEQREPVEEEPRQPRSEWGGGWPAEPDVCRVANGVPHRVDRLRTLGNAVVPQVAEWVGRRIMEATA